MRHLRSLSLLVTLSAASLACAAGCATVPAVTAPGLALKRVVIYRNGVGYFERAGRVDSDTVQFKVRRNEVGDFLATLAVLERGGSSVRAAAFPLSSDAAPAAPGAAGGVASGGDKLETVVMSLDGKGHDLDVGYIAETPIWRPSYRLVIDKQGASLQAWGIVQNLSGEDWKNVSLSLVAEAPLAFDASLARAVVPPRPQITDGGDVIAVVPQTETSLGQGAGAPPPPPSAAPMSQAAPAMDMDEELRESEAGAPRKKAARRAPAPVNMGAARGGMADAIGGGGGPGRPYSGRARNLSALATVALQAGATRYDVAGPVTVPDKSATMVMLLDKRIPGEAIALFAPDAGVPDSSAHPFRVARFTNQTGGLLERGPLAIFSDGAFLGQGMTDPLPDGATATVPFALERTLAIELDRESREEGARLYRIEAGTLTIARDRVTLTQYRLRNGADREAKLLLKHPRVAGARLTNPPPGTEDNVGSGSALVPTSVAARNTGKLTIDERQQVTWAIDWLVPLADEAVRAYLADKRADASVAGRLGAAWETRKVLTRAIEERQKLAAEDAELRRATDETRANIKALEKNTSAGDLRAKLTARLAADAARLDQVSRRVIEVDLTINEQRVRFTDAIREIKLLQPLAMD
jgi:hypothetical protein